MFEGIVTMKTSSVLINLARVAFVVLAYKEIAHPKAAIIPPGVGRPIGHYLKSCYQIGRGYLQGRLRFGGRKPAT